MRGFHVPIGDDAWPEEAWGKNLGRIVHHIRHDDTYKGHREELKALGIDFSKQKVGSSKSLGWDVVKPCLVQYKAQYKPKTTKEKEWWVQRGIHVPKGDADWQKKNKKLARGGLGEELGGCRAPHSQPWLLWRPPRGVGGSGHHREGW